MFHFHPQMGEVSRLESSFNFFHWVFHWICEKEAGFPTVFSTFSTEFSTVLEAFRYTCCILPGGCWKLLGRNGGIFSFFQKKVEPFSFLFSSSLPSCKVLSPRWNAGHTSFPHRMGRNFFVLKTVGKPDFSTEKERLHLRSLGRCSRSSSFLTSYSGTRSARSGSTGSNCRHPRWW